MFQKRGEDLVPVTERNYFFRTRRKGEKPSRLRFSLYILYKKSGNLSNEEGFFVFFFQPFKR